MTNKYAVFTFRDYYPEGGWDDFRGCCETLEKAIDLMEKQRSILGDDSGQVVDLETSLIVKKV